MQDFLHLPAFAAFYFSIRQLLIHRSDRVTSLRLAIFVFSVGALIELVQSAIGRSASWYDLIMDVGGIALGYLCWLVYTKQLSRQWLLLGLSILLLGLVTPFYWLYAYWQREQLFPLLLDFDTAALTGFVSSKKQAELTTENAPAGWVRNQTKVGRLQVAPSSWPGVFVPVAVADWRKFDYLNVQVFSTNTETVFLAVRVDDVYYLDGSGDNFDRKFSIAPGVNDLRIPLEEVRQAPPSRHMDMQQIQLIFIYVPQPETVMELYLDNLRLERSR